MTTSSDSGNEQVEHQALGDLLAGVGQLARQLEPIATVARQANKWMEPLARFNAAVASFADVARHVSVVFARCDSAERLMERGWMPHRTTPFELATNHLDDIEALRRVLLAYYNENWREVRSRIEVRLSTYSIDDEAKATFREALGAHEIGYYQSVCRLLFPEIERLFRGALFGGRAGNIRHEEFVKRLAGWERDGRFEEGEPNDGSLFLEDFLTGGIHEFSVFEYLTGGLKERGEIKGPRTSRTGEYRPSLFANISDANIEAARGCPIPTRHAVVHGLVNYSTPQSSLNAIFIADYIFSVISRLDRDAANFPSDGTRSPTSDAGTLESDARREHAIPASLRK